MTGLRRSRAWQIDTDAKRVVIPASVMSVRTESFPSGTAVEVLEFEAGFKLRRLPNLSKCRSLKSICIPSSVTQLQSGLFFSPEFELTRFVFPLETIAFAPGSSLRQIDAFAFGYCSFLKSITLPASVSVVNGASFCRCGLSRIEVEPGNKHFAVSDHFLLDITGTRLIRYFGENSAILIPDEIEILTQSCFEECKSVVSVEFGHDSRASLIEDRAFCGCSQLSSISIPSLVTAIGPSRDGFCFADCKSLRAVTFCSDEKLKIIGEWAFQNCSLLEAIAIPSSVEVIGESCFWNCENLVAVTFPADSKLLQIDDYAFCWCASLASFCVPSSVAHIGHYSFGGCSALSDFSFVLPSRARTLLDVPGDRIDIPDSIEKLAVSLELKAQSQVLDFGYESKLDLSLLEVRRAKSSRINRCFLRFSPRAVKIFRSSAEFWS
jgi:hypothetical protein